MPRQAKIKRILNFREFFYREIDFDEFDISLHYRNRKCEEHEIRIIMKLWYQAPYTHIREFFSIIDLKWRERETNIDTEMMENRDSRRVKISAEV